MKEENTTYKIRIEHKVKGSINLLTIFLEQSEIAHVLWISRYCLFILVRSNFMMRKNYNVVLQEAFTGPVCMPHSAGGGKGCKIW